MRVNSERVPWADWARDAVRRARTHLWLKAFGIPGCIALFFVAYFLLLYFPLFPVTVMPVTALDRWIRFQPWAIVMYFSLWIYISLPPTLLGEKRELVAYFYAVLGLSLSAMLVFIFWPTATPVAYVDWARYPEFGFLKSASLARNAFPSLHAGFAVFSGLWLARLLRGMRAPAFMQIANALWALAILYSTIATRQHVSLDIYAGSVLGVLTYVVHRQVEMHLLRGLRYHRFKGGAGIELSDRT